jgi:hypothetical protein
MFRGKTTAIMLHGETGISDYPQSHTPPLISRDFEKKLKNFAYVVLELVRTESYAYSAVRSAQMMWVVTTDTNREMRLQEYVCCP